jgi:hypothetical protein
MTSKNQAFNSKINPLAAYATQQQTPSISNDEK